MTEVAHVNCWLLLCEQRAMCLEHLNLLVATISHDQVLCLVGDPEFEAFPSIIMTSLLLR